MYYRDEEHFKSLCGYVIDDVWYPRVTKIIDIKSKPALYRYYAETANFAMSESFKQKSATEGTKVHEAAEKILLGEVPDSIDPDITPSIKAFKEFLGTKNIQSAPELVERRIVNYDARYAGTIDAVAFIDGKMGVLDIKTSQDIYRDYNLQTAAYVEALKPEFKDIQTRWILRIDQKQNCARCGATRRTKGGREKIKTPWNNRAAKDCPHEWAEMKGEVELREFPYWHDDFEAFLGAKKLWEWENIDWLKRVEYL